MEFIKPGDEVLYVWHGHQVADLEQQVNEIKKIANVRVENAEVGLPQGKLRFVSKVPIFSVFIIYTIHFFSDTAAHSKSSFNITLVNVASNDILNDEVLKILLNLTKPKGKVVFHSSGEDFQSRLLLTGFVNVILSGSTIGNVRKSQL